MEDVPYGGSVSLRSNGARRPFDRPLALPASGRAGIVELATVHGSAVALPTHFHDEDQITFVLVGRRRFRIGGRLVEVGSGQGVCIAAGTPHSSLAEPEGVACFNAYLRAGVKPLSGLVEEVARRWAGAEGLTLAALADILRAHRHDAEGHVTAPATGLCVRNSVRQAAEGVGMSREGFSRRFRRTHGMPPSVFRSLAKLNAARRRLRAGAPLAAIAAEVGFADQSHLGRCFRRAFGVTPGRYRAAWAGSHPFQTSSGADV